MDFYHGLSTPDGFGNIDELLDFSNDDLFTSSTTSTSTTTLTAIDSRNNHHHSAAAATNYYFNTPNQDYSATDFTDDLCVPDDDIAELEWLSNFVDDSFTEFPANSVAGVMNVHSDATFISRSRSKRSRSTAWTSSATTDQNSKTNSNASSSGNSIKREQSSAFVTSRERSESPMESVARKCTHCASEKTPQWRTGPLGPKTLCNACGVRFKSGRLVPEYRPAASPTFVLTQHSNSHRKVLELRRQKDLLRQQQQQQQEPYGQRPCHFQAC